MDSPSKINIWAAQFRAPFLLLAVVLVLMGLALSLRYPSMDGFNILHAVLLLIGIVSAHISVNLFNEYSDYKTGIDFDTQQTPFSGGTKMMIKGHTNPKSVKIAAYTTLMIGLAIGAYFTVVSHWFLSILIVVGALTTVYYTTVLAKLMLGEFASGLALGYLVVVGVYIAMTANQGMPVSEIAPLEVWLLSIPAGILTSLLLLLNEFPDVEADTKGGRFHLLIKFGWKKSAVIYILGMVATFGTIIILPILGISSYWVLLALIPIPIAVKASQTAIKHGDNMEKLVPALGQNVIVVLAVDFLLAVGVFISAI
jgi:1,4-dihydroxy-2-naphthoate polyprenyltransferase